MAKFRKMMTIDDDRGGGGGVWENFLMTPFLNDPLLSGRSIVVVLLLAVEIWSVKKFFWFIKNFYSVNSLKNPLGSVYENPYGFPYGFCKKN